jgi:aldose 1-epimerase
MSEIKKAKLSVSCSIQNHQADGIIYLVTLKNRDISVSVTNCGCTITAICTPDKGGHLQNIVAGYADLNDYRKNEHYFGCLVGRYANRIGGAKFILGERQYNLSQNDGPNHLHGGFEGFNKKLFQVTGLIQADGEAGVEFEYLSPDEEEGSPGNLAVKVKYTLSEDNQLRMSYEAKTDRPTPVNLTNHSYFNLTGFEAPDILAHELQINARSYTETIDNIPTGNILPVSGTPHDFSVSRPIKNDLWDVSGGYNQNFVLGGHAPDKIVLAARLSEKSSGRFVSVYTDQPGLQLYTANVWDGAIRGPQGKYYQQYGALALETQNFPDSPNHPAFPSSVLYPGDNYHTTTIYEFGNDH